MLRSGCVKYFSVFLDLSQSREKCRKEISTLKNRLDKNTAFISFCVDNRQINPTFSAPSSVVLESFNTSPQELGQSHIDSKKLNLIKA